MTSPAERAARHLETTLRERDFQALRDLLTPDFTDHSAPPGTPAGPDGYVQTMRYVTETLGITYQLDDLVADGDRVALRATAHGTHNVSAFGFPATGGPSPWPPCTGTAPTANAWPSTGACSTRWACWLRLAPCPASPVLPEFRHPRTRSRGRYAGNPELRALPGHTARRDPGPYGVARSADDLITAEGRTWPCSGRVIRASVSYRAS